MTADYCGVCHRSLTKVRELGIRNILNVRFQPYRLQNSKCWTANDRRISCLACHDPHLPIKTDTAFYDRKCISCHQTPDSATATADQSGRVCPVSDQDCTVCHMRKTELPGAHFKFTDHWIRVIHPGDPYPL